MTGYTVHTGSTKKFAQGWDRIFGGQKNTSKKKQSKQRSNTRAEKKKK